MILKYRPMQFMAAADDGGGAAVMEPPVVHADAPTTSISDVYKAALAKEQGEAPTAQDEPPEKEDATPPAKPAKVEKPGKVAEPAKPASAIDAAFETTPDGKAKADEPAAADPLKELPETLPREGRGEHWQKARGVIETQGKTIGDLTKQIAALSKQAESSKAPPPELVEENTRLKATLDSYKDAIVAINVEQDPEFRAKYIAGRENLVTKAASKLSAYGGNGDALKDALAMPEGRSRNLAIKEAMGELEDIERSRVMQFVGEVEKLDDEKAELQKDPQGTYEKFQRTQAEARQKEAERVEAYKADVFAKVSKTLPKDLMLLRTVPSDTEGAEEWNSRVEQIKTGAFELLGDKATPEQLTEAALWAKAGPILQGMVNEFRSELSKARAALKEYEGAEPGFRGGKPPKKSAAEENIEKTPGQIFTETMAALSNRDD